MELSEVVNVQFAFPVVGVVLCAFLVFAFGFKSPGQPPSFDAFDDDDRKTKRSRTRKPAGHSDKHKSSTFLTDGSEAHSVTSSNKSSPTTKQSSQQTSSGSGSSGTTGKSLAVITVTAESTTSNKNKLQVKSPKKSDETSVSSSTVEAAPKDERVITGEWTTAVSKKDRKNRGKKEENIRPDKASGINDFPKVSVCPGSSASAPPTKLNKKLSEMTTFTVIVPAPTTASSSTSTCTTVTQNAVIKVKVVPSVRVTTNQTADKEAKDIGKLPTYSDSRRLVADVSSNTFPTCPWKNVANDVPVDTPVKDFHLSDEEWSEVKASKSPKRKKKQLPDAEEKYKEVTVSCVTESPPSTTVTPVEAKTKPSRTLASVVAGTNILEHSAAKSGPHVSATQPIVPKAALPRPLNSKEQPPSGTPRVQNVPTGAKTAAPMPAKTTAVQNALSPKTNKNMKANKESVDSSGTDKQPTQLTVSTDVSSESILQRSTPIVTIETCPSVPAEASTEAGIPSVDVSSSSATEEEQCPAEDAPGSTSLSNHDGDDQLSNDETGDWCEAKSQKKKRKCRKEPATS